FPTGHAYGLRTEDGLDLLMHIGMDTVELDGKHFEPKVAKGDTVKRGDVIEVKNTSGGTLSGYDGLGDWNIDWETWSAGNADEIGSW
ncbi:PTS sugar transporter subunit IIA, partial [Corynebacterium propinquum]